MYDTAMDVSELKTTAELANLSLSDGEFSSLGGEVEKMLDYFSLMREAGDFSRASAEERPAANRVRRDERAGDTDPDVLIENAPEREDRFIVIPNVL
ncbi:MAG: aspartyl/glutamyl-tRNA amidotransferase subunit C [Spirochaetaceae bacterium]|nr:aspartyl/glutamyl-tRNA amidotransferase subunit C [Spirochaetaceae bacterium]